MATTRPSEEWLTLEEMAKAQGVTPRTIQRRVKNGTIVKNDRLYQLSPNTTTRQTTRHGPNNTMSRHNQATRDTTSDSDKCWWCGTPSCSDIHCARALKHLNRSRRKQ